MKFLVAITAIILALGLSAEVVANEPDVACSAQNTAKCPPAVEAHGAKSGQKDLATEMNSLFPEKQQNSNLSSQPAMVELTSPKFLSKVSGTIKLEWKPATGANAYHVQVATDPNFKWLVAEEHFDKTNSFSFTKGEPGKKYYWRVAAFNTNNDSMYTKSNFSGSVFETK